MTDVQNNQVLIMSGYPGSGKSTLAKKIAKKYEFNYLSSDLIRKELYESDRFDTRGHDFISSITQEIYDKLYERAISLAKGDKENPLGKKVIIDGTHLYTQKRSNALDKIKEHISPDKIAIISIKTSPETIRKRITIDSIASNNNSKETLLQGWERVYGVFEKEKEKGLISWPDRSLGIDIIDSTEIYKELI